MRLYGHVLNGCATRLGTVATSDCRGAHARLRKYLLLGTDGALLEFISWPRYFDSTRFDQASAISAFPVGRTRCMGLNAVYLPDHGWYRVDPRGNKDGVDAQFDPPQEKLAWAIRNDGEINFSEIYAVLLTDVCRWLESNVSFE